MFLSPQSLVHEYWSQKIKVRPMRLASGITDLKQLALLSSSPFLSHCLSSLDNASIVTIKHSRCYTDVALSPTSVPTVPLPLNDWNRTLHLLTALLCLLFRVRQHSSCSWKTPVNSVNTDIISVLQPSPSCDETTLLRHVWTCLGRGKRAPLPSPPTTHPPL